MILSLFPGIGLLDHAFELEGFCVVRGPDLLWGGDIRKFHPPAGKFDGVIGGPPCQPFSRLVHLVRAHGYEPRQKDMIPEFARVVREAKPSWWLMENVPAAYAPIEPSFELKLDNRWVGGEQPRVRHFWSNLDLRRSVQVEALLPLEEGNYAVLAGHGPAPGQRAYTVTTDARRVPVAVGGSGRLKRNRRVTTKAHKLYELSSGHPKGAPMTLREMCRLQGLPQDFTEEMPFTAQGKRRVIGNGVPLPMGRAVARAVKEALAMEHQERNA